MKRTAMVIVFLLAGFCVFAQNGTIRELNGTVEIKRPGSSTYAAAKVGDQVSQDTVISTALRSIALVEIGSAVIMVQPLTRLSLKEISSSASSESINVYLQTGRVRVDVNPSAGKKASMSVTSPSATASVRGTSFDLSTRNIYVQHGAVSFTGNRGRMLLVNTGSDSHVKTDGRADDPLETRKGRLLPSLPAGMDTRTGAPVESNRSNGTIIIDIKYL
ncbi:MAG: FecR family protein [Treponema sp.]|nr:FecR family protein [Treponema sp.]